MFLDSLDALAHTIEEGRWRTDLICNQTENSSDYCDGPAILDIEIGSGILQNGIRYCSVQVQYKDGRAFQLQGLGDEADELCHLASCYRQIIEEEKSRLKKMQKILTS